MKLVAFSSGDVAGSNIARILKEEFKLDESFFVESDEFMTEVDSLTDLKPEVCFVASRHRSESSQPTLTAHVTGNFGSAELGGRGGELALAPALYLREAVRGLFRHGGNIGYSVSLEVTHHGPTALPFPLVFVEVGSTAEHWSDLNACRVAARVISDLMLNEPEKVPVGLGFGGPHYAPNFTAVLDRVAVGHIASKHVVDFLDEAMVRQMVEKTTPKPDFALFDWKGLRSDGRKKVIDILGLLGLPYHRTSGFKGSQ